MNFQWQCLCVVAFLGSVCQNAEAGLGLNVGEVRSIHHDFKRSFATPKSGGGTDEARAQETAVAGAKAKDETSKSSKKEKQAKFETTAAQDGQRCALLNVERNMYITPYGSTPLSQWGGWQLNDGRRSLKTATFSLDFLASSWQTAVISTDGGKPALIIQPTSEKQLKEKFGWDKKGDYTSFPFFEKYKQVGTSRKYATYYNLLNYTATVAPQPEGDPQYSVLAPDPVEAEAFPVPSFAFWALTDCEGELIAVMRAEETNGTAPGRTQIFDKSGVLAAEVLPDPVVAKYQFIDHNDHLIATAESVKLNLSEPYAKVPRFSALGNIVPYTLHFEIGAYKGSSPLMDEYYRWIVASAVQVRMLMDAHAGWTPELIAHGYLLLAVCCAAAVIALIGSLYGVYSCFSYAATGGSEPFAKYVPRPKNFGTFVPATKPASASPPRTASRLV
eukprot:TRINITY_DN9781_c0_g1_i1.p1 TRINITY_DN9781_c0_g1~~TRINITY_DN9781_c0_g1_i1.p1  ORF type:complete len:445 (+),score=78.95 TRINITY_DN9781_c0_g1_i1:106-1440(+)